MKKKPTTTKPAPSPAKRGAGYPALVKAISAVNTEMVTRAAIVVNQALVLRNWIVGACIVEFEQNGADRAKYGARLLETLAADLKGKGVKGLIERTLRDCRTFYLLYPQIRGLLPPEFEMRLPDSTPFTRPTGTKLAIRGSATPELPTPLRSEEMARLSWTKLQELIRIDDPWKRAFYENECLRSHWSVSQLQRQIGSLLYERTGLSTDKKSRHRACSKAGTTRNHRGHAA